MKVYYQDLTAPALTGSFVDNSGDSFARMNNGWTKISQIDAGMSYYAQPGNGNAYSDIRNELKHRPSRPDSYLDENPQYIELAADGVTPTSTVLELFNEAPAAKAGSARILVKCVNNKSKFIQKVLQEAFVSGMSGNAYDRKMLFYNEVTSTGCRSADAASAGVTFGTYFQDERDGGVFSRLSATVKLVA